MCTCTSALAAGQRRRGAYRCQSRICEQYSTLSMNMFICDCVCESDHVSQPMDAEQQGPIQHCTRVDVIDTAKKTI